MSSTSSDDSDFVRGSKSKAKSTVFQEDNAVQIQTKRSNVVKATSSEDISCGGPECKKNPPDCPNTRYRQALVDVAKRRGFDLSEYLGSRFSPSAYKHAVEYANFLFSLRALPAILPGGATFILDEEAFAIVLLLTNGELVRFCSSFRCLKPATIMTNNLAFCAMPSEKSISTALVQYATFFFYSKMTEEELRTKNELAWRRVQEEIRTGPKSGISEVFGHVTIVFRFRSNVKNKGVSYTGSVLCAGVSRAGAGAAHCSMYMCQSPYCGKTALFPFLECASHASGGVLQTSEDSAEDENPDWSDDDMDEK